MKNLHLVSVIIPIHNGEKTLTNVIENIKYQDYDSLEIIIVDDGSTDKTSEIATQYQNIARYIYQPNSGTSAARNLGIKIAQGNIIAFLDVNDKWSSNALKLQLNYLENNPSVEIVQGMSQDVFVEPSEMDNHAFKDTSISEKSTEPYYSVNLGSAIYRKSVFDKVGLFDESLKYSEDIDWFVRAWENRIIKSTIEEVTLLHSKHPSSIVGGKNLTAFGFLKVYKKHIKRLGQQDKSIFPSDFPSLNHYISSVSKNNSHLKDTNFSIISNDCWGGAVYQKFRLMYKTPFVGTRIFNKCYLKLLKNLKSYLEYPLEFSRCSRYESVNLELKDRYFPIGTLNNDVEIHFYHETNEKEAKDNWERRLNRMNWDNIFVKFSDYRDEDFRPLLKKFEVLSFPYKVCFTSKPYPEFSSAFFIPDFWEDAIKLFYISRSYFDVIGWLNKASGSDLKAYQIKAESE